ncbi:hypothetical protein ACHAQA_002484 [Verticillium albo-atrum]
MTQGSRIMGVQSNQECHDDFPGSSMSDEQAQWPGEILSDIVKFRNTTATPPATEMPWKQNEFHHIENRDLLSPNGHSSRPRTVSESGGSGPSSVTFKRIETMPARGILSHASFEHRGSKCGVGRPSPSTTMTLPTESPATVKSVRETLRKSFVPSGLKDTENFLPLNKLSEIVTPDVTREMLLKSEKCNYSEDEVERIVQGVFQEWPSTALTPDSGVGSRVAGWQSTRRRRILTILILINRVNLIHPFISNDIDDLALPIDCTYDAQQRRRYTSGSNWARHEPPDFSTRLNACFEGLGDKFDLFKVNQKRVHVPFFQLSTHDDTQIYHYNLDAECVLPIIAVGEMKKGGNATVQKVVFHPASYNYKDFQGRNDGPAQEFALKRLKSHGEEAFREEVEIFERLVHSKRPRSPDHLLRLELAFMHGEQGYLLFPWAEGSLKEYWQNEKRDPTELHNAQWFFEQCYGLALGLRRLHDPSSYKRSQSHGLQLRIGNSDDSDAVPDGEKSEVDSLVRMANSGAAGEDTTEEDKFGRHTDVKPDNILWYRQYEEHCHHLVLSDFGSAQFNSHDTRSNVLPGVAGRKGTTNTYQAPELIFGSEVTRRYDIWSLGCVFLEFAVWFHQGGWPAVDEFAKQRTHDRKDIEGHSYSFSEDMFYLVVPNNTPQGKACMGIKPSVAAKIKAIRDLESCSKATEAFLDLIQNYMLVADAAKRLDGDMIRHSLNDIRRKCRKDFTYATCGGGYEADFQAMGVSPTAPGYFDGTSPETQATAFSRDAEETLKPAMQDTPDDIESAGQETNDDDTPPRTPPRADTGRTRSRMISAEEVDCINVIL